MNYLARYGLEYNPFTKETVDRNIINTKQYKEITARLNHLLLLRGFGLVIGEAGLGKTTAIRNWVKSLNQAAYKIVYVPLSTISLSDFYRYMAIEFGYEPSFKKVDNFRNIQSAIERLVKEKKVTPIVILDEANYLSNSTLNDLKILFNFDMDSMNHAAIILAGLPTLLTTLNYTTHEPLRQRINVKYVVNPLSLEESETYVKQKLKNAGCNVEIFDQPALNALVSAAQGKPRMIDKYVTTAMMIGDNKNENIISEETIYSVTSETEL